MIVLSARVDFAFRVGRRGLHVILGKVKQGGELFVIKPRSSG